MRVKKIFIGISHCRGSIGNLFLPIHVMNGDKEHTIEGATGSVLDGII